MLCVITLEKLVAAGVAPTAARAFVDPLRSACSRFKIESPKAVAMFLAQCAHESRGFEKLEENLWYTSPARIAAIFSSRVKTHSDAKRLCGQPQLLANTVYSGRDGNGPASTGDGWRYRGRGLLHLTFAKNYKAAGSGCARPYFEQPELVGRPDDAALSAAWYFASHGLVAVAERGTLASVTSAINPANAGQDSRALWLKRFDRALA